MDFYLNLFLNSLVIGSLYSLLALAFNFNLIFNRILNLAIGGIAISSGYIFYYFFELNSISLISAILISFIFILLAVFFIEYIFFKPFKKQRGSFFYLIISLAILIILTNVILLFFGESPKTIFKLENFKTNIFQGLALSYLELVILITFIICVLAIAFLFKLTKTGLALKALADNFNLTEILGISKRKLEIISLLASIFLSYLAGIFIASEFNLEPNLGPNFSIKAFIASIIGGGGQVLSAVIGSFILSSAENISIVLFPSAYKDLFSFLILFLFLIFWPKGIIAKRE